MGEWDAIYRYMIFQADIDLAVKAATAAFKRNSKWRSMDASARGKLMIKAADLMQRDLAYLAVSHWGVIGFLGSLKISLCEERRLKDTQNLKCED